MNLQATIVLAVLICLAPAIVRGQTKRADPNTLDCMIQPDQIVQVGTASPGLIDRVLVRRGDLVSKGQLLVQMESTVERAALAVARERARQVGDATIARSTEKLAQRELQSADELYKSHFVSRPYLDKRHAEAGVASGRSAKADESRRLAIKELALAIARLEQRIITAPIDGVVIEQFLSAGEFVDQKPVMRLAAIDPLRVDVLVPASAFGQIEVGQTAQVLPEIFTRQSFEASVSAVDRVIDAASNTFRVRLAMSNPNGSLPAGLRCQVDLGIKPRGANAPIAGSARAAPAPPPALAPGDKPHG